MKEDKSLKKNKNEEITSEQRNLPIMHKVFYSEGKHDFNKLGEEWELLSYAPPVTDICHYDTPLKHIYKKEIWDDEIRVYKNEDTITAVYSNPQTLLNKFEINLRNYSNNNLEIVEKTKSMLERKLECKLNDVDNDLIFNLDLESN